MKLIKSILLTVLFAMSLPVMAGSKTINGAGATFPYPVYSQWGYQYNKLTGVKLNYQSIGSGGGIAQIKARTVDFGASDAPLEPQELAKDGLFQFPMVIGGVVPVVNIEGIKADQLKLDADTLAQLYLGKINKWNDAAIKKLNPDLNLPDRAVTVVHRADGSGTTWIFTDYLSKISPEWKKTVGTGKAVAWPTGVGGKGNEGVAAYVQRVNGALGYVEYAYALQNKMAHVQLKNRDGVFVSPTIETFQTAAANADWESAPGYYLVLTDQPGEKSWPITGASFIIVYEETSDAATAREVLKFFDWCYKQGGTIAKNLHYVPIPDSVVDIIQTKWAEQLKGENHAALWP